MTERSLPRLEDFPTFKAPWRPDRPAPETVLPMPAGPPSWDVAYELLTRFLPEEAARRETESFAKIVVEGSRLNQLAGPTPTAPMTITAEEVIEWLETVWLAREYEHRGLAGPEQVRMRWKRLSERGLI